MPLRFYICDIVHNPAGGIFGLGESHAAFIDVLPGRMCSVVHDMRSAAQTTGKMLVRSDVDDADHTIASADVRILPLPFESATGASLSLTGTLAGIPVSLRNRLFADLEANHIPMDNVVDASTVKQVIARIVRRMRLRRILGADDLTEGLNTSMGAIAIARQGNMGAKLQARGLDVAGITVQTSVRQALILMINQSNDSLNSEYD